MSEHEILIELERCGVRTNTKARAQLAKDLDERGVLRADIALAFAYLVEQRQHDRTGAARVLASLLDKSSAWVPFVAEVHAAQRPRSATEPRPEHGSGQRTSPAEQRVREYRAAGLSDDEARLVARGGYVHARIVGDLARPADVAREFDLDPFEAIHAAAHWADLFGHGRAALRKALERAVRVRIAAESLLEELDLCPVRELAGEKPAPILTGWRARAPKPTRTMRAPLPVVGDPEAVRALQDARQHARALLERVKPKPQPQPQPQPVAARAESVWDAPVYGEGDKKGV